MTQKKSIDMKPDWPIPDAYLTELGRMAVLWGTLESIVNVCASKLLGFNDPFDARPAVTLAHANFKQRLDILSSLCSVLEGEFPDLAGYKKVIEKIDKASVGRNRFVHGNLSYDPDQKCYVLAALSARGALKIKVEPVTIDEIKQVSKNIHNAGLALHNLVTVQNHKNIWGESV